MNSSSIHSTSSSPSSNSEKDKEDDGLTMGSCSSDEALLEMLGLSSLDHVGEGEEEEEEEGWLVENGDGGDANSNSKPKSPLRAPHLPVLIPTSTSESESDQLLLPSSPLMTSLREDYSRDSICIFPREFSIPADRLRRLTEALVWGGPQVQADRTYETIQTVIVRRQESRPVCSSKVNSDDGTDDDDDDAIDIDIDTDDEYKNTSTETETETTTSQEHHYRRTLTRLEHFVDAHQGWSDLCHGYLRKLISATLQTEMVLYKEKLNLKPPGGGGFAPHLDTPSLRIASAGLGQQEPLQQLHVQRRQEEEGEEEQHYQQQQQHQQPIHGPRTFVTVMVAIDDMHARNGCLRVCKGQWSETNCVDVIQPELNGNPDAGGRAGAIPINVADQLEFEDIECKGGTIVAFNGWVPHRSSVNAYPFPRRAVFLTYNPKSEGDFHERYYKRMEELRNDWRRSTGLSDRKQREEDERMELEALATIPKN